MTKLVPRLLVALIICCAAGLRLVQVNESLWLDELHTAWTVADGPGEIADRAAIGNHSPVYFFLVWIATKAVGMSELAVRLPSAAAGVTLIALVYWIVSRWTGCWSAGLLAALLAALDRNCVFYGQEARPYAWVQLVGLAHVALFASLVSAPTVAKRIGAGTLAVLLFYLHYTAGLLFVAEFAFYALLCARGEKWRPKYRPWQLLVDFTVVAACLLPASPHLLEIASRKDNWAMFVEKRPLWAIRYILPLRTYLLLPLVVLAAATLIYRVWPSRSRAPEKASQLDARNLLLVVCWLFVPIGVAWVTTERDLVRLFFLRYVIVTALAPIVFSAFCYAFCRGMPMRIVCAVVLVIAVIHDSGMIKQYRHDGRVIGDRNQDWRSAVRLLNDEASDAQIPVFVRSGLIEADRWYKSDNARLREYCLLPVLGIYRIERDAESLTPLPTSSASRLSVEDRKRVVTAGEAWFLVSGRPEDIERMKVNLCRGWNSFGVQTRVAQHDAFGNVAVLRLTTTPQEAGR